MPPHRVAAVLQTLAPNSIPRLSPPRAPLTPNFLPGPLSRSSPPPPPPTPPPLPPPPRVLTLRARRVSRRNFPGARRDTPIHHYRSTLGTTTIAATTTNVAAIATTTIQPPVAITFGASTFTSSNPTMCCLRSVSAELPSSFQIQPLPRTPPPFPSFHSDSPLRPRSACHPFLRIYPARFLLRFSFKFHPTFSTQPHLSSRRRCYRDIRCIYISRARLLPSLLSISFFLSYSLLALGMRTMY